MISTTLESPFFNEYMFNMFAPSMKRKRPQSNAGIPVASQPIAFWFPVTSPSYPIHILATREMDVVIRHS